MATNPSAQRIKAALREIERNLTGLPKAYQNALRGKVFAAQTLRELKRIPGPPNYKIRWTSDRQRAAFFASNGFGRGIPTRRKGKIAEDWEVLFIPSDDGAILVLSNPHPEAKFIHGPQPFGQGFHIDTGWTQIDEIEETFYTETIGTATAVFFDEINPFE